MDIKVLTVWIRSRYELLKQNRDDGQSSAEMAVIVGALLVAAGLLVVAIKAKLLEKIGIINSG